LAAGHLPPKKVAWLNPLQLVRTGYSVWLVTAGTGILDRREMLAALDQSTVRKEDGPSSTVLNSGTKIDAVLADREKAAKEGVWIDFLADVGDSWEATYAVASLLVDPLLRGKFPESARHDLHEKFGPAGIVVLGGDLVYPVASRDRYRRRFRAPFAAALPDAIREQIPAMFTIPGNHDWYDGLTNFCREFCHGGGVGGWQLFQRRSYFAVKLTHGWWLWGIDIALDTRIDAPQQAYFLRILQDSAEWGAGQKFEPGDRVILCSSKPSWVEISRYSDDAYQNLVDFVKMIERHGSVPVILTGDLHHYSRYANASNQQMIVSGGGGAYLMGTHFLPDRVPKLDPPPGLEADKAAQRPSRDRPKPEPSSEFVATGFEYPSRADSRLLALRALLLPFRPANWSFCLLAGVVYWLLAPGISAPGLPSAPDHTVRGFFALPQWIWRHPGAANMYLVVAVILMCALLAIFINNRASRLLTTIWGTLHGAVHVWLAVGAAWFLAPYWIGVAATLRRTPLWSVEQYALPAMFVLIAGLIAGTVTGIYLVISDRFFDLHHNDVFAVQSLIDYRNFVRLHIRSDGVLEIYPIGLRRVPRRWRRRIDPEPDVPLFEPADEKILPHLIEGPIRIKPASLIGLVLGSLLSSLAFSACGARPADGTIADSCPYSTKDYTNPAEAPYEMDYLETPGGGFNYRYFSGNSGPLVVLVAGLPEPHYFDALRALFVAAQYRVLVLDLPGKGHHSLSSRPTAEFVVDQFQKLWLGNQPGFEKETDFLIVGTSMSGPVTALMAARWAAQRPRLALVSALGMDRPWPLMIRLGRVPLLSDLLAPFVLARQVEDRWRSEELLCPHHFPELFKRQDMEFRGGFARINYLELGKALILTDQTPAYRQVAGTDVPVLLVNGDRDPFRDQMSEIQKVIQRAGCETIENAKHIPFIEQPDATFKVLVAFLTTTPSAPALSESSGTRREPSSCR
jgi:alpha-beta hydrolase superfamily lysophospholipase